jgi:hypothetical protein
MAFYNHVHDYDLSHDFFDLDYYHDDGFFNAHDHGHDHCDCHNR